MHLAAALGEQGFEVSLNEPYTGKSGLIYSVARHGRRHDIPFMELELRNDLINTPDKAVGVARRLWAALDVFQP
jgi:predicted N-formylglutamate amidohydrolase